MKMDVRDIRTLSFLVSQGKGFPMRNMRDELTFDPGLGQTGHNGSSKVAGYFNNWHNVAQRSSSRSVDLQKWSIGRITHTGSFRPDWKIKLPTRHKAELAFSGSERMME